MTPAQFGKLRTIQRLIAQFEGVKIHQNNLTEFLDYKPLGKIILVGTEGAQLVASELSFEDLTKIKDIVQESYKKQFELLEEKVKQISYDDPAQKN